jgi:hypothetical protein
LPVGDAAGVEKCGGNASERRTMPKVDAKIELIRTEILRDIERVKRADSPTRSDEAGVQHTTARNTFISGLQRAIKILDEVQERVK